MFIHSWNLWFVLFVLSASKPSPSWNSTLRNIMEIKKLPSIQSISQNPETSKVPTLSDESYDCETKTVTQIIENNVMQEKQSEENNCDSDSSYYEIECSICQARFLDQKCMNDHIAKKHVFLST